MIGKLELGAVLFAAFSCSVFAQGPALSLFDGTTPSMNTPGSPAETYRLSEIDNINLITGRVSFAIPLADIPGRGAARTTLVAHLETYWKVAAAPYPYNCGSNGCSFGTSFIVTGAPWYPDDPDYVSGVMQMRGSGDYCENSQSESGQYEFWQNALTRLTYIAPDGTETEFRDNETGGLKEPGYPIWG
jgi:hypothetical protein